MDKFIKLLHTKGTGQGRKHFTVYIRLDSIISVEASTDGYTVGLTNGQTFTIIGDGAVNLGKLLNLPQ